MTWDEICSCRLNSLLGGDGCETFCSRVWICSLSNWKGVVLMWALDHLFAWKEPSHCWNAHLRHLRRNLDTKKKEISDVALLERTV